VYLPERNLTYFPLKADEILHSVNADALPLQHAPNKEERRILKHELFIKRMWRLPSARTQNIIILLVSPKKKQISLFPFVLLTRHTRIYG
jgi:hypothetical protein